MKTGRVRKNDPLTIERLKELIRYDPVTGNFHRIKSDELGFNGEYVTGCVGRRGYKTIGIDKLNYMAHRLAFLYMTGKWPKAIVDHINGDGSDNRWCNLREASSSENQQNRRIMSKQNTSGLMGVTVRGHEQYEANIGHVNQRIYLGTFKSAEEAHSVYLEHKAKLHPYYTGVEL